MKICLYGASSTELNRYYLDAAYELGRRIAAGGHTMIYGGGAQGVMGAAACGVTDGGGALVGVAPTFFQSAPGVLFDGCTEFICTQTMAERKTIMMERADAFVMAPGGIGTYEEFFEVLTLKQLGRHNPALAVLNTRNYYDPMQALFEHTVEQKFAKPVCLQIYRMFAEPGPLVDYLEHYDPNEIDVRHIKNI